jgi:hypothetical protein
MQRTTEVGNAKPLTDQIPKTAENIYTIEQPH